MKSTNKDVFLTKITQKVLNGDFDNYLNIPFHTKELLLSSIKNRIARRIALEESPIISDKEITECIYESELNAFEILNKYIELGFLKKDEDGITLTELGYNSLKLDKISF